MKYLVPVILMLNFIFFTHAKAQDATWPQVVIPEVAKFKIPPTMEVQNGAYKIGVDGLSKQFIETYPQLEKVTIQPIGTNQLKPDALKLYGRLIVVTEKHNPGDFSKLKQQEQLSKDDIANIDALAKTEMYESARKSVTTTFKMKIVKWEEAKSLTIGGVQSIRISYVRTINDAPPVHVEVYNVFNNDAIHKISISYRQSEADIWRDDLSKCLKTFEFTER